VTEDTARYVTVEEMDSTVTGQNMRRGAYVLPIVDYDPTTETRNVEDGAVKLWVSHGRLHMSVFSLQLNGAGAWSTLSEEHVGTIKMFYGSAADIDAGWQLCDGTNGTPDLRDKFILGGDFNEIGIEQEEQALVIADHVFTDSGVTTNADGDYTTVNDPGTGGTVKNVSVYTHFHTAIAGGGDVDSHSVTTPYAPPSYKLAFIMKVS